VSYQTHIFLGLVLFALAFTALAFTALAQQAQNLNQPVVAPFVVDNTNAQTHIRQFQNFRQLQAEQNGNTQSRSNAYQYERAQEQNQQVSKQRYNPLLQQIEIEKPTPSALEEFYASRIIEELEQFGYSLFGVPDPSLRNTLSAAALNSPSIPSGAVQDHFVLGHGDELEVFFTGQRNDRANYTVNSQGLLVIPDFPPIPAAGRTIGQVRISIEAAAENLLNTTPYVSLSNVRQIGVLVVGHVKRPGRQTLTVFHTVLDALMEAGGIEKTGSLRQVKLVRDGRSTQIDLYALLLHGSSAIDLQLRDGDRIIIPSIGPTVAIAGEVKRPGIYEILPSLRGMRHKPETRSETLTLNEMLELGGGVLAPGKNRFMHLGLTATGQEIVRDIADPFKPVFADGSVLQVSTGQARRAGTVELIGHTRRPGLHALGENPTLSALLPNDDILGADIYPLIGVIERRDPELLTRTLLDFPPLLVVSGDYDRKLHDGDVVHLFSNEQIRALEIKPLDEDDTEIEQGSLAIEDEDEEIDLLLDDEMLTAYLRERGVFVRGAVRDEGPYPVSEGITLDTLLAVSGGLALEADRRNIEITSDSEAGGKARQNIDLRDTNPETVALRAGDSVRVNQKFNKVDDNSVLIMGEVQNPGRYDLVAGDRMSNILERAGGLTQQAYPYGAIFSRASERKAQEMRFKSQARQVKMAIAAALETDDEKVNAGKIAEARSLADELENAKGVGRITVEADPATLTTNPELDLLMEHGDRIFIPRRNLNVRVVGEVLSPATLQFRDRKEPRNYIEEAGGFTFHADKERTFVLYPDGSAQPLQVSAWNYKPIKIPPGSTIVIPRDPKPFDFIQSAKDVSQILSNLAVTAIFIDDVADDN
jgi:protein involved in polysaccharide export with SLBB domain